MADDLPLPRLRWDPITESFSKNTNHKRARLSSPPASSDPALFSSDDDPSADNYTGERRKRKYRGPWFQQRPADSVIQSAQENRNGKRSRRTFERQLDSGVFMGSDGTDIDEILEELESKNAKGGGSMSLPLRRPLESHVKAVQTSENLAEDLARGQIARCLDEGDESVDLSSRGLKHISNATIRPLATFTRVPSVVEGVYTRLDPKLKVFLASNELSSLPEELLKLSNMTALSLRANQFEELPPAIGKLSSLKELNLSQNRLRCLPYEILELCSANSRLQSLNLHPNPFYLPQFPHNTEDEQEKEGLPQYKIGLGNRTPSRPRRGAVCAISPEHTRRSWHMQWNISYLARTEVRYLDINGSLLKGPDLSRDSAIVMAAEPNDIPQPPTSRQLSRAPSMLEVALKTCTSTAQISTLSSLLHDDSPPILFDLLNYAAKKKESGGSECTRCGQNFILPRTEWIEWWEVARVHGNSAMASAASPLRQMENERDVLERMVPFIRRGCSWLCVPEAPVPIEENDV